MNELTKAIEKKIEEVNLFPDSKTYSKKQMLEEILNPLSELINGTGDILMTDILMAASFAVISTPGRTEETPPFSYAPPFWNKRDILAILINLREFSKESDKDPLYEFIKMFDRFGKD